MELILTGTGTSQGIPVIGCTCEVCTSSDPKDDRLRTATLIRNPSGKDVAIDCGPDFRRQMLNIGQSTLEHILITHEHMDHVAGIDDVRAFNFTAGVTMNIWSTERVQDRLRSQFAYAFHSTPYPGAPRIELKDFPEDRFSIEGLDIDLLPVEHGKWPVVGFRIGDTAYITDVNGIPDPTMKKLQGLRNLVIGVLHRKAHHSHFNFEQGIEVAQNIGAQNTYFTHISHHMGRHNEVNKELPSGIELAYDGLRIPISIG